MLTQNKLILVKIESPYGSDPTPTTGANFVAAYDIKVSPAPTYNPTLATDISLSKRAGTLGTASTAISFKHQLQMNVAAPPIDPLLLSCGFTDSDTNGVYVPRTTGFQSCTVWVYEDGICYKVNGCRGNAVFDFKAGEPVVVTFSMQGLWAPAEDLAYPTSVTDNGGKPCVAMNRAFTFTGGDGEKNPVVESLSFSLNNTIALQKNMDDAATYGIEGVVITGRDAKGSFNPEVVLAATTPAYWTDFAAVQQIPITYVVGDGTDNLTVSLPKCELENITPGDLGGIAIYDLPFSLVRTTADDEISLTFADDGV